ncbi:serine palmitoyltransferase [Enteropsectra breve]|nr:serine palmitoyltransferase [Enteropsectra breve]
MIGEITDVLFRNKIAVLSQTVSVFLIFILVKYRFRNRVDTEIIKLKKRTVRRLIEDFKPEPLVPVAKHATVAKIPKIKLDCASYDIFNLGQKYKNEIKETIAEYGIGCCGPRGFYGTLDLHLTLEAKIAQFFKKEDAVLYSNHFTCVQSVINCFCRPKNVVYFYEYSSEAIMRGLLSTNAGSISFSSLEMLEGRLSTDIPDKYVVVERFSKNTGEIIDLQKIKRLRETYGFRLILDETHAIPFMFQSGEDYEGVDIVIGSLAHGYPGGGAFVVGSRDACEFQRLSSHSYVFSASLPGYLATAAMCFFDEKINYTKISKVIELAFDIIPGIISDAKSPILLIKRLNAKKTHARLLEKGIACGVNSKYLRICLNENITEKELEVLKEELLVYD